MFKLIAATLVFGPLFWASAAQIKFDFAKFPTGQPPAGFVSLVTGKGAPAKWTVEDEAVAPTLPPLVSNSLPTVIAKHSILTQSSPDPTPGRSPLLLFTNETLGNFSLTTRFKIVSGSVEPAAGLVFRARDENNYYVVRASTQGNLLWYRVVNGVRYESAGLGVRVPIARNEWHDLTVECNGTHIRCYLNGQLAIPPAKPGAPTNDLAINDTTFATGTAGFWTESDTVACFGDTRIDYAPRVPMIQTVVGEVIKKYPRVVGLKVYSLKNSDKPVLVADGKGADLGSPGGAGEADVIAHGTVLYLKESKTVELTMPLRDRNGDAIAAVKITLNSFRGETSDTAVTRATVIKKALEDRLNIMQDINE